MKLFRYAPVLNILWIAVLLSVLLGSLYIQFFIGEQPCRLCTWQRMTMFFIIAILLLNIKFGQHVSHYGLIIIFSLFGASVSIRQILSYIIPGSPGFGPVVFGMHTYTWALLVFLCSILASGVMLILGADKKEGQVALPPLLTKSVFGLAMVVTLTFSVATLFQCGLDVCPAATEYNDSPGQEQGKVSPDAIKALEEECCPNPKKK